MKILLFTLLAIAGFVYAKDCFDCILEVESHSNLTFPCIQDGGSLSCGPYQLKKKYYTYCGLPEKEDGETIEEAWKKCSYNSNCARTCIQNYHNRYKETCANLGKSECEIKSRLHNGGDQGCTVLTAKTDEYWDKIKKAGCDEKSFHD